MSFNVVNKTTGATTQIAGNADDRGIGNLNSLTTTNKSSLVSAINEVNAESNNVFKGTMSDWNQLDTEAKIEYDYAIISNDFNPAAIGNLSALHTTDQSSIVGAINEIADTKQNISDNSLNTTSKTIPGAINELKSGLIGKYGVYEYNLLVTLAEFDGISSYGAYLNTAYNALQGYINNLPNGLLIHIDRMNIDNVAINNPSSRLGDKDTTVGALLFATFVEFDIVSGHLVVRKINAINKTYEMIDNGVYSDISSNVPAAGGYISVNVTIYSLLS